MELKSLLFSSKTNGVDTALNFNGRNEELAGSEAEDDDEWEFKDANAPSVWIHVFGPFSFGPASSCLDKFVSVKKSRITLENGPNTCFLNFESETRRVCHTPFFANTHNHGFI